MNKYFGIIFGYCVHMTCSQNRNIVEKEEKKKRGKK